MAKILILTTILMVLTTLTSRTSADPSLFFSKDDLPMLRERVKQPPHTRTWEAILKHAEAMCTPGAPGYADPEKIDEGRDVRIQVLAHTFGRRLTVWVETLGFAYQITGEERFGKHGARILVTAAKKLPVTDERVAKGFAGARGDLMRGFAVGLDWLGEAPTPEERRTVEQVAADYVQNILTEAGREKTWWIPYHNFMGVALGAGGMLAMKLKDSYPGQSPQWVAKCADGVALWLDKGFDEQGAYYEGVGYAGYGLSNAVRFADALLRNGGPNLFEKSRLRHVPVFYAQSLLPGQPIFDARNDSNYVGLADPVMLRLASALPSGLAKWLWEYCGSGDSPMQIVWANDVRPTSPKEAGLPLAQHFIGRGLCVFRTGWDAGDVMFSVEAGPYYKVTHNQADKGHFALYGHGCAWAIDSGYGNTLEPEGRAQMVAHNCILIDGKGQTLSGCGLGTDGNILICENNDRSGYVLADCTDAYNKNSKGTPGVGVQRALRHTLFVRPKGGAPAYAVVLDDIRKDETPHDYTWFLHAHEQMHVLLQPDGAWIKPLFTSGGALVETPTDAQGQGECAWTFDVKEPGRYVVWGRIRSVGPELSRSDSFFAQMDNRKPLAWHTGARREWAWRAVAAHNAGEPAGFELAAGAHTFRLKSREPGSQVDRIVVTLDLSAQPPFPGGVKGFVFEAEDGKATPPMHVVREPEKKTAPRMKLVLHAAAPAALSVDAYDGHPRLKAVVRAVQPNFAAVLLPLPPEVSEPDVQFEDTVAALRIHIRWEKATDIIEWPKSGDRKPRLL
ncbi:MAG: heparinase II/III family protein [Planctomycetota bacterium]